MGNPAGNKPTKAQKEKQKSERDAILSNLLKHIVLSLPDGRWKNERSLGFRNPNTGETLLVAWPELKVGLAGGKAPGFVKAGWEIITVTEEQLLAWYFIQHTLPNDITTTLAVMEAFGDATKYRKSLYEKRLALHIKDLLPIPNFEVEVKSRDGQAIVARPDFTWEDIKFCIFVDGTFWHGVRDVDTVIRAIKDDARSSEISKMIKGRVDDKVSKDLEQRSDLIDLGWTYLAISHKDLDNDVKREGFVDKIVRVYQRRVAEIKAVGNG